MLSTFYPKSANVIGKCLASLSIPLLVFPPSCFSSSISAPFLPLFPISRHLI